MPRKKYSHVHQYQRVYPKGQIGRFKGVGQWECALPDCTHYIPRNISDPVGKLSCCNNCGEHFILDEDNMVRDKPICDKCANPDAPTVPIDFDWERMEAKAYIAKQMNRPLEEISEAEIDRMIQLRRLNIKW